MVNQKGESISVKGMFKTGVFKDPETGSVRQAVFLVGRAGKKKHSVVCLNTKTNLWSYPVALKGGSRLRVLAPKDSDDLKYYQVSRVQTGDSWQTSLQEVSVTKVSAEEAIAEDVQWPCIADNAEENVRWHPYVVSGVSKDIAVAWATVKAGQSCVIFGHKAATKIGNESVEVTIVDDFQMFSRMEDEK